MVILMKARLGLDREKLAQQGTVALRLGFLPAATEAIAALSILVTAPLGAWAIPTFAPKLLEQREVDPTKVGFSGYPVFLAAVDTSAMATDVFTKVADLARRSNGSVIVLHVDNYGNENAIAQLKTKIQRLLADIRHEVLVLDGVPKKLSGFPKFVKL